MDSCFMGQILLLAFDFTPEGFAPCDGQLLRITDNPVMFSIIGTRFGGDGTKTFALPDYRGTAPAGSNYFIALKGIFPPRSN